MAYQRLIKRKKSTPHQKKNKLKTHSWKREKKKKRKKEATPAENPSQNKKRKSKKTTPSEQLPLYKPKTSLNYQIFSEDSETLETLVRKDKIDN